MESDGCFDPAQDLTHLLLSEDSTHPQWHAEAPETIRKQRTAPETKVLQSHLSRAGCDVITNCTINFLFFFQLEEARLF